MRDATRRNHTATHLLHAALRKVLGPHVKQAGSLVAPDRLRFDFMHFSAVTREQLTKSSAWSTKPSSRTSRSTPRSATRRKPSPAVRWRCSARSTATRSALSPIGDGGFSTELCGGTHVRATGDIGVLLITEESGVAAGVRRIEAVTGLGLMSCSRKSVDELNAARALAGAGSLPQWIDAQSKTLSKLQKENQQLKTKLALGGGGGQQDDDRLEIAGATLIARQVNDVDTESLRTLADTLEIAAQKRRRRACGAHAGRQSFTCRNGDAGPCEKGTGRPARQDARAHCRWRRRRPPRFRTGGRKGRRQNYRIVSGCSKGSHQTAAIATKTA